MMRQVLSRLIDRVLDSLSVVTTYRFWKAGTAVVCTLLSILLHNPDYSSFDPANPTPTGFADYRDNWKAIYRQSRQPLRPQQHTIGSHQSKIAFRLAPALIGRLFPATNDADFTVHLFLFQHLLGLIFFYLFLSFLCQLTGLTVYALLLTLGLPFIYLGNSFFWDTYGWFDGIAYFALLAGLYALVNRQFWLMALLLTVAFWTDERAIVVSPVVFFWLPYIKNGPVSASRPVSAPTGVATGRPFGWTQLMPLLPYYAGTVLAYGATRLYIGSHYKLTVATSADSLLGVKVLFYNTQSIPYSFVNTFDGYWLPVVLAIGWCWQTGPKWAVRLALGAVAASWLVAYIVLDVTRSLTYLFVWVLLAVVIVAKVADRRLALVIALAVAVTSFMAPTLFFMGKTPVLLYNFAELKRLLTQGLP